jgi:hypothetical protein
LALAEFARIQSVATTLNSGEFSYDGHGQEFLAHSSMTQVKRSGWKALAAVGTLKRIVLSPPDEPVHWTAVPLVFAAHHTVHGNPFKTEF